MMVKWSSKNTHQRRLHNQPRSGVIWRWMVVGRDQLTVLLFCCKAHHSFSIRRQLRQHRCLSDNTEHEHNTLPGITKRKSCEFSWRVWGAEQNTCLPLEFGICWTSCTAKVQKKRPLFCCKKRYWFFWKLIHQKQATNSISVLGDSRVHTFCINYKLVGDKQLDQED